MKGGAENSVSVNPQTVQRIQEYLRAAEHGDDAEGPLFRPVRKTFRKSPTGVVVELQQERHLHPDMIDRILRKWVSKVLGVERGFSAHSMRETFITTALENGASLEDVQRDGVLPASVSETADAVPYPRLLPQENPEHDRCRTPSRRRRPLTI